LLVAVGAFLGGSTQRWSQAIVIGLFAILLFVSPPRHSLGPFLNTLACLFLLLGTTAFLPAHWFSLPAWRVALTSDFGVPLGSMVSAQPWMSLDSFVLLIAGLVWIYYLSSFDASLRGVRLAMSVFAWSMVGLALFCLLLHWRQTALPFWHNARGFGPFPNRNQTGDLFGISTLAALGCLQDDFRRGHKRWILWVPSLGILVAAVVVAYSRAGILILVIGFVAWVGRLAFRRASGAGIAVGASILLILFAGLMLFGGETIERFNALPGSEGPVTSDYRWLVFRDVWAMIHGSPWCGIGIGNFESVFALYRNASRGASRALHPESDWLWVWSEMGWLAVLLLALAGIALIRRAFPLREGTNQRLRYAALVGALLFAVHGFVDVSGHRWGSFLAGTFLFGMAQLRPNLRAPSRWLPILFRIVALFLAVVSLGWLICWRWMVPLPGRPGVENAKEAVAIANRGHRFKEAVAFANQGLEWAPLNWQLYFLRALARIGLREPIANPIADFRRARFLEPSAYQVPFEEGKAWLGWQPTLAITAWRDALQRRGAEEPPIFPRMLESAANYDNKVFEALHSYASDRPRLTIYFLEAATPEQFQIEMDSLLKRDPDLKQFSPAQQRRMFELWANHEPLDRLLREVQNHPDWMGYAWQGLARYHARQERFAEAWELVRQYAPRPAFPQLASDESLAELEHRYLKNPDDLATGYALYRAEMKAGKLDDALNTVRHFTMRPDSPAYFNFLEAETWAVKGNWQRAWQSWVEYQMVIPNRKP
jgi:O-antigen ligase